MAAALSPDAVVAVIGAGAMGAGIAQIAAQSGHRVLLFDARIGAAEDARQRLAATLKSLAQKGKIAATEATNAAARMVVVHALGDCVSAALVIEAIVEDVDAKRGLFRELERIVAPGAILASNTSSLSITALGAGLQHPERVVGMHFFNPAPVLPLVEVISGLRTAREVAETIYATASAWGKSPVHAQSTPGFIVNRCARPFYGEALRLLAEGAADAVTLDALMRDAGGFRMGPFELIDLIGLDVNFAVTKSVWEALFHDPRYTPSIIQQEMVAGGLLGRKSGKGFYDYAGTNAAPKAAQQAPYAAPSHAVAYGDVGPAGSLLERFRAAGIEVQRAAQHAAFPDGVMSIDDAWVALTDGRTATERAMTCRLRNLVVFDLALDYAACRRLAVASADSCSETAAQAAAGALQAANIDVSRLDDVAGLCVMRTVAMLVNEAAEAVRLGVASAADVDIAMRKGVNYPRGPLGWADAIGPSRVREVLTNLGAHYGEDRYRISPLLARRCASGSPLAS